MQEKHAFSVIVDGTKREIQNTISKFQIECEDCIVEYFKQSSLLVVQNMTCKSNTKWSWRCIL